MLALCGSLVFVDLCYLSSEKPISARYIGEEPI
jgi:hypothetical protein